MISLGNINLDKAKFENFFNFKFRFYYTLFYTFLAIYFIIKISKVILD